MNRCVGLGCKNQVDVINRMACQSCFDFYDGQGIVDRVFPVLDFSRKYGEDEFIDNYKNLSERDRAFIRESIEPVETLMEKFGIGKNSVNKIRRDEYCKFVNSNGEKCNRLVDNVKTKLCKTHYKRKVLGLDMEVPIKVSLDKRCICIVDGCDKLAKYRNFCGKHYSRSISNSGIGMHDDVQRNMYMTESEFLDWVYSKTESGGENSKCLNYTGSYNKAGYPVVEFCGRKCIVTRLVLELTYGIFINPNWIAGHRCDNPKCISLYHLEIVSNQENQQQVSRKADKSKRHKLTIEDVDEIRKSDKDYKEIAMDFDISPSHALNIINNKVWKEEAIVESLEQKFSINHSGFLDDLVERGAISYNPIKTVVTKLESGLWAWGWLKGGEIIMKSPRTYTSENEAKREMMKSKRSLYKQWGF